MKQSYVLTLFLRLCISFFWIGVIFAFLSFPLFMHLLRPTRSINILVWADLFNPRMIKEFEQETNIKVFVSYFTSNEELFVKMKSTQGGLYDLIMPSDYMVEQLAQEHLLQPLDKQKFNFWDRLDKRLLHVSFDPNNTFSVPYYWGIYGLGVDTSFFGGNVPPASWSLIFKQQHSFYKIAMPNVAREAIMIAGQYLFGTVDHFTQEQLQQIATLLKTQKKWVEVYLDFRPDHLLVSKTCPVVVTSTPSLWRFIKPNNTIQFLLPEEGSFFIIDALAIPSKSTKADLVHQFINFVYKKSLIREQFMHHIFFPATTDLQELFQEFAVDQAIQQAHLGDLSHLSYFKNSISETEISKIWISLKA